MLKNAVVAVSIVITVALLGPLALGAVFAQEPTETPVPADPGGWYGMGPGHMMLDELAELLGMSPQELFDARKAGKTLAEIGAEKGFSEQQLGDALLEKRRQQIEDAVADGDLTREQADWLIQKMEAMTPFMLSNPFTPRGFGGRWGAGPGCWWGDEDAARPGGRWGGPWGRGPMMGGRWYDDEDDAGKWGPWNKWMPRRGGRWDWNDRWDDTTPIPGNPTPVPGDTTA